MELDLSALFRTGSARASGWRRMPAVVGRSMIATSHPLASAAGLATFARGRQCGRRRARRGRRVDRRRADRQRPGRRCVRARVARREAPRPQRLRPLAARAGRDPRRRARPALRDGSGSRARLERPRRAVRPLRARSGARTRQPTSRRQGVACTPGSRTSGREPRRRRVRRPRSAGASCCPMLAGTLGSSPSEGPDAFYRGRVAAAIAGASWLTEQDLELHRSEWVEPLRLTYRGVEVCELPPTARGRPRSSPSASTTAWSPVSTRRSRR